jgi:hypothetical protein
MSAWKRVALVNIGGFARNRRFPLHGSASYPMWIWAAASALYLTALNYFLIRRIRRGAGAGERNANSRSMVMIYVGLVFLVLQLAFRY